MSVNVTLSATSSLSPARKSAGLARPPKVVSLLLAGGGVCMTGIPTAAGSFSRWSLAIFASLFVIGIFGLLTKRPALDNLLLAAWCVATIVFLGEGGMELFRHLADSRDVTRKLEFAAAHGTSFDLRSQSEYVLATRARGTEMYRVFPRGLLLQVRDHAPSQTVLTADDGTPLLPLGSISNVLTAAGNETGQYLVYMSDEHGFHNPSGIWSLPRLKIAVVGDSFVHGESVPSESNMIAVIRREIPETLNLGHSGNGPLSELATILEYLPQRRPDIVLWVFCEENDLQEDLEREKHSGLMMGYLDRPVRLQHLEARQREIDEKLRGYFEAQLASTIAQRPSSGLWLKNWLALHELTFAVSAFRQPDEDFALFERVLTVAKSTVSSWNGSLVFVYLPMQRLAKPQPFGIDRSARHTREQVLQIASRLSIPVLDIETRFVAERSRLHEYFYPFHAHLTETGYRRVGELVMEELRTRGLLRE